MPEITAQHHELMASQGYCLLENVFTVPEMEALADSIETFQKRHTESLKEKGGTEGISRANEITFTSHLAEHDPAIMEFCRRPEMISIGASFIGGDMDLFWNQSVYKMPEGRKEFPWHQDDAYKPVTPAPYLTLWIALNDATPENGCISALPGSHQNGLKPHENTPLGLACHAADDPDQGVLIPVKAGSIAVFWSQTAHKSGANLSKGIRKAYIVQYAKAGLKEIATGEPIPNLAPIARNGQEVE